jgi:hypothetical protein
VCNELQALSAMRAGSGDTFVRRIWHRATNLQREAYMRKIKMIEERLEFVQKYAVKGMVVPDGFWEKLHVLIFEDMPHLIDTVKYEAGLGDKP